MDSGWFPYGAHYGVQQMRDERGQFVAKYIPCEDRNLTRHLLCVHHHPTRGSAVECLKQHLNRSPQT